jgi:hypothetical protein
MASSGLFSSQAEYSKPDPANKNGGPKPAANL